MKTRSVKVGDVTWLKLAKLKLEIGAKTFDEAIAYLLKSSAR